MNNIFSRLIKAIVEEGLHQRDEVTSNELRAMMMKHLSGKSDRIQEYFTLLGTLNVIQELRSGVWKVTLPNQKF